MSLFRPDTASKLCTQLSTFVKTTFHPSSNHLTQLSTFSAGPTPDLHHYSTRVPIGPSPRKVRAPPSHRLTASRSASYPETSTRSIEQIGAETMPRPPPRTRIGARVPFGRTNPGPNPRVEPLRRSRSFNLGHPGDSSHRPTPPQAPRPRPHARAPASLTAWRATSTASDVSAHAPGSLAQ